MLPNSLQQSPFATSDIISHMTISLYAFLHVVNLKQPSISHGFWDIKFKHIVVTALTFWGHVTSSVTWIWWGLVLVVNLNQPPVSHACWDIELQRFWSHHLDLYGHVTSSVMWLLYSQYGVFYRCSAWTDRLSRTVFEILSFKDIGATAGLDLSGSRDVIGHVTIGLAMFFSYW